LICAQECLKYFPAQEGKFSALDLGCGVGRSTFELARVCEKVVGIDFSEKLVDVCNVLKQKGSHPFSCALEGKLRQKGVATVDPAIDRNRCTFIQGDVCKLPKDLGTFDVVLAANLVDRLKSPSAFLADLPRLVKKGGVVVLTTPYSWLEQYSSSSEWIGGFEKNGQNIRGFDGLKSHLSDNFSLLETKDLPFAIRNHLRHFQLGVSHVSIWKKRG